MYQLTRSGFAGAIARSADHPVEAAWLVRPEVHLIGENHVVQALLSCSVAQHSIRIADVVEVADRRVAKNASHDQIEERLPTPLDRQMARYITAGG